VAPGHDSQSGEQKEEKAGAVADRAELAPARIVGRSQTQGPDGTEEQESPDDMRSNFNHGPPSVLNVSNPRT
jgi:hypothetical protein